MTNRKNYNSILFLTVYLGLVLVGAAPQVLAHAASNSLFDLRNEIEFKDDLDNKPDDSCSESKSKTDAQDNQFIEDYIKLVSASLKKYPSNTIVEILGGIADKDLTSLRKDLSVNFFQIKANKEGLLSKINFNPTSGIKKTTPFILAFNQSLNFERSKTQNFPEKVIYENTKITSQNNQIFIVTRLPRGSIDSLLKQ
jgi:hypothetical protein